MTNSAPLVTILGAGIAGLTAAHELIERGFDVQVIERSPGDPTLDQPDIGGVARTQWCTVPEVVATEEPTRLVSLQGIDWLGARPGKWSKSTSLAIPFDGSKLRVERGAFAAWAKKHADGALQIVMPIYLGDEHAVHAAYARWRAFEAAHASALAKLRLLPLARVEVDAKSSGTFVGLLVRRHHQPDALVAGEHGYRVFPGCYRHLRDTMRRTPLFDHHAQRFTTATVHDNLTPIRYQVVADPTRDSRAAFSRRPPTSLTAVWKQYQDLRRDLGYRPADLLRFSLRQLRYMTSSTERRRDYYERMSWWDFLTRRHLDRETGETVSYGQRYRRALDHAVESVVAVESRDVDARTIGNFSVQLTTSAHGEVDATLRGPSSEVWFGPWRAYLESRGVRFIVGEVTKIDTERGAVHIEFPRGKAPEDYRAPGEDHHFVCAMDAPSVARVATNDVSRFVPPDVESLTTPGNRKVRFQTLTGIQLFYSTRLSPDVSHIYYADSAWGLTAISQVQQWQSPAAARLRLSSTLSINIGAWHPREALNAGNVALPRPDQTASAGAPHELDARGIASEVQRQLAAGRAPGGPRAVYYHIDDSIQFAGDEGHPAANRSPYLVNLVGDWDARPKGEPWSPSDTSLWPRLLGDAKHEAPWEHEKGGYLVYPGNIVFAGPHMRTFTRLTSMEAANESARHAVNAILDHLSPEEEVHHTHHEDELRDDHPHEQRTTPFGAYCDIWDPEQNEHADLDFVRLIDKHLVRAAHLDPLDADDAPAAKGPKQTAPLHLFDLLGLDHLPDLIDDDVSSERLFELLGVALDALQKLTSKDASSVFGVVDTFRKKFSELVRR